MKDACHGFLSMGKAMCNKQIECINLQRPWKFGKRQQMQHVETMKQWVQMNHSSQQCH